MNFRYAWKDVADTLLKDIKRLEFYTQKNVSFASQVRVRTPISKKRTPANKNWKLDVLIMM